MKRITLANDVDDVTVAAIKENSADLPGVNISDDTTRVYKNSKIFCTYIRLYRSCVNGATGGIKAEKTQIQIIRHLIRLVSPVLRVVVKIISRAKKAVKLCRSIVEQAVYWM